ncbi:copper oxidase [Candidatus Poribacteria bacterium]|nr:MAG: copper oxidase [Candidatus Poribacteria bacterium]
MNRRDMLKTGALVGGAVALGAAQASAAGSQWENSYSGDVQRPALAPGLPGKEYTPVITPNISSLPWKIVDGVKVFHLVAEEVWHTFAHGLKAKCWGYNGKVHGPTIEAVEGERIRIYVTNKLQAPTSVHWHGVFLPNGMDGVGGLTQRAIPSGKTFKYEWTVRQSGTYMYHSHHDEMTQMAMGMMGMLVFHPRNPSPDYKVDRDFAIMLSEWRIDPGTSTPNPNEMNDFNVLTMNAKCYPGTEPLVAKMGDRVRIRFGNLSAMDHHSIHLHGHYFKITATNGGRIATSAQHPGSTLFVPVGDTQDIEFIASDPGDWAIHCHMTHHVMNQMGHDFPNVVGVQKEGFDQQVRNLLPAYMMMGEHGMGEHGIHVEAGHMPVPKNSIPMVGARGPFDYITMGGMFTLLKVREQLASYADPGWYKHPPGTVADVASTEELRRDLG